MVLDSEDKQYIQGVVDGSIDRAIRASESRVITQITDVIKDVMNITSETTDDHDRQLNNHERRLQRLERQSGQ